MGKQPGVSEGNPHRDTERKQELFLAAFEKIGIISRAAETAKIGHGTVKRWRDQDPLFLDRFNEAKQSHNDRLESVLFDLINEMHVNMDYKANPTLLIFALNGAMPEKYKGTSQGTSDAKDVLSEFRKAMRDVKDAPPKAKKMEPEEVKTAVEQAREILQSKRGSLDDTDS
jgi:molybdenum-dependent DNA-binding transcriptional regulator ModE